MWCNLEEVVNLFTNLVNPGLESRRQIWQLVYELSAIVRLQSPLIAEEMYRWALCESSSRSHMMHRLSLTIAGDLA